MNKKKYFNIHIDLLIVETKRTKYSQKCLSVVVIFPSRMFNISMF